MSLLEQAKLIAHAPNHRTMIKTTDTELLELALAYFKGEVALVQCTKVMYPGKSESHLNVPTVYKMASKLREAIADGRITINLCP